jgi:LysM repeat protein
MQSPNRFVFPPPIVISSSANHYPAACSPIPGLSTATYSIDFTQQTETAADWILADHATVTYGAPNGANFTFAKRKDAPYIWTRFYILFGRIEVVLKAAPGAGIITGAVMMSDDADEIDWEWSGNNFAQSRGQVQTNFFGKGIAGTYGRGTAPPVDSPQDQFHTYALDWTPDALTWSIDGNNARTLNNNGLTSGEWQYPQTPSRLHLGLWCSGDPETNSGGTVGWGGGPTDFNKLPYSAYVKSVRITTPNPCSSWNYPNPFDGTYRSVQCTNQTISLPCTYAVVAGDDGYKIAKNLTVNFDNLKAANPDVNWDGLLLDQTLKVPGGLCSTPSTTSSATTTPTATSSVTSSSPTTSSSAQASTSSSYLNPTTVTSSSSSSSNPYVSSSSTTSYSSLATSSTSTTPSSSRTASTHSSSTSSSSLYKTTSSSRTPSSTYTTTSSLSVTSSSKAPTTTTSSSSSSSSSSTSNTAGVTTSGTTTSSAQSSTSSQYKVVAGDYGYIISQKLGCNFEALKAANPGLDWDKLNVGQSLNVPSPPVSSSSSSGSSTATQTGGTVGSSSTSRASTATSGSSTVSSSGSSASSGSSSTGGSTLGSRTSTSTPSQASTTTSGGNTGGSTEPTTASPSSHASSAPSTTGSTFAHGSSSTSGSQSTTSHVNVVQPTVAPNSTTSTLKCNEDNCLRNLLDSRYLISSSVYAFCTGYITATSNTAPIPTYLGGCSSNATRVSSACSCLVTNYANASGIMTKTASSGAASSKKRSILRWERARW